MKELSVDKGGFMSLEYSQEELPFGMIRLPSYMVTTTFYVYRRGKM